MRSPLLYASERGSRVHPHTQESTLCLVPTFAQRLCIVSALSYHYHRKTYEYGSYNFGQDVGRTQNGSGSYLQLLSMTDESEAWVEF